MKPYIFINIEDVEIKLRGLENSPINQFTCRGRLVVEYIKMSLSRLSSSSDSICANFPPPPPLIQALKKIT